MIQVILKSRYPLPIMYHRINFVKLEQEGGDTFLKVLEYMKNNDIPLVVADHDFPCPKTGKNYMYFPAKATRNSDT